LPPLKTCVLLLASVLAPTLAAGAEPRVLSQTETVVVRNATLKLKAQLWRPDGRGPFPAVLFNHGSGRGTNTASGRHDQANRERQAAILGPVFARHGYAFLFLYRRGAGPSAGQGTYSGDLMDRAFAANGQAGRNQTQLTLLETDEIGDALAGLAFLRGLAEVDARRVAVAGHSFGGSLALLLAERDTSLRAVIDFASAANSWAGSPPLRARLLSAVAHTTVPIFVIQAANDYSLEPARVLGAEMERLGKPHRIKIYEAFGQTPDEGHSLVYLSVRTWEPDVFAFLDEQMRR
jgi:carboxymethylenebutenolidase